MILCRGEGQVKRAKGQHEPSLSQTWLLLYVVVLKTREAERQTPANPWVP